MGQFCALVERVALLQLFLAIPREEGGKNDRGPLASAEEPREMQERVVGVG